MRQSIPKLDWRWIVASLGLLVAAGAFWYFHEPRSRTLTESERERARIAREKFMAEHPEVAKEMAKRGMR